MNNYPKVRLYYKIKDSNGNILNDSDLSFDKKLELMKTINEYSVNTDIDEMDTISFGRYEQDGNVGNGPEDIY